MSLHPRGCDLRLCVGAVFLHSQCLANDAEAAAIAETWRRDLMAQGWSEPIPEPATRRLGVRELGAELNAKDE